jgi:alpha-N-arabinofuranosidase
VNASSISQQVEINLVGAAKVKQDGRLITLSATTNEETNSIDEPTRIVPVESKLRNVSEHFYHAMPGYAIQVLEINLQ